MVTMKHSSRCFLGWVLLHLVIWTRSGSSFTARLIIINLHLSKRRSITTSCLAASHGGSAQDNSKNATTTVVAIIGGGWAGFSAADALSSCNNNNNSSSSSNLRLQVHLLDASPRGPGGLAGGGWKTTTVLQQPVHAGMHGFWREYRNTAAQIKRIGLDLDKVLTPYMPSLLVSSTGRVAVAPVLGEQQQQVSSTPVEASVANSWLQRVAALLPPPLDMALLAEYDPDSELTIADRLSALGLLGVWADFEQQSPASWKRYDAISADQLFRDIAGVSPALFQQLVAPLLHVLPMTTAYDCSAAAALSCFHVFALQSRGAFDVRWCRGESIADAIFDPWVQKLRQRNVRIRGSAKLTSMEKRAVGDNNNNNKPLRLVLNNDTNDVLECDAVVLAVGATAAKRMVASCPALQAIPHITNSWQGLRGVTCVAVRLFLNQAGVTAAFSEALAAVPPVTVCGPAVLPELVETGFCVYDLNRLQDKYFQEMPGIMALEVDFFRADCIANLKTDQEVIDLTLRAMEAALLGSDESLVNNAENMVLDSFVVRARDAVSHFCVGSASTSPPIRLDDDNLLYMCGDWIDRTGHASWSTEKAVVTGRQAAAAVARDLGLPYQHIDVIPATPDTPQLAALRRVAAQWRAFQEKIFPFHSNRRFPQAPRAPWTAKWSRR